MRKPKTRGVPYEDVRAVVDDLVAKGADINEISLRDLRDVLGTGSYSTLAKHLDACKDDIIYASKGANALMEEHVAAVASMMGDIVSRATFDIKRSAEAEIATARTEAHRSQRELAEAREIAVELEGDLDKARADAVKTQATIADKDALISRLEGKVEGLEHLLDRLQPNDTNVVGNRGDFALQPTQGSLLGIQPADTVEAEGQIAPTRDGGSDDQSIAEALDAEADARSVDDEGSAGDIGVTRAD